MVWLNVLSVVLPTILEIIEKLLGPKTGAIKKELAMSAAKVAMQAVGMVSTGGQAETWDRIKPMVSTMIDAGVAIAFPKTASSVVDAQKNY